ncbi:NifB/NifX family molybdenum-iron cluster-binding protein [Poriferisphaera sp. WC338]|uniref:NifB/NifX family molybdenum-iron cluster-binding protein n=1 Tax=Poriferisphaera sp. WC338 TaxID=3425129 RepID=UPI003D8196FA
MRIAVPVMRQKFSRHFGKSDQFIIYHINEVTQTICGRDEITRDVEACHALAAWVDELNIDVMLVGGIGMPAKNAVEQRGVRVVQGIDVDDVEEVVNTYLADPDAAKSHSCWGHTHCRTNECGHD